MIRNHCNSSPTLCRIQTCYNSKTDHFIKLQNLANSYKKASMRYEQYFLLFLEFENQVSTYVCSNCFLKYGAHCTDSLFSLVVLHVCWCLFVIKLHSTHIVYLPYVFTSKGFFFSIFGSNKSSIVGLQKLIQQRKLQRARN